MQTLSYHIDITATPEEIWNVLWDSDLYMQWTRPFDEGSRYEGNIEKAGNRIYFLSGSGGGMYSTVKSVIPSEYVVIEHLGALDAEGRELPPTPETEQWSGALESYRLVPKGNGFRLEASVDADVSFVEFLNERFPQALQIIKRLSEGR